MNAADIMTLNFLRGTDDSTGKFFAKNIRHLKNRKVEK